MTAIRTDAAAAAVGRGIIDSVAAQKLESIADQVVALRKTNASLGVTTDAFETIKNGAAYRALSPVEQQVLAKVYAELIGQAATAIADIAATAGASPGRAEIEAAYHTVSQLLDQQRAYARRHGPGTNRTRPDAESFTLEANPDQVLRFAQRVKGLLGSDPHILVTYDGSQLEAQRTGFLIAASDLTPATFVAALRTVLRGAHAKVELRAQPEDEYQSGKPALTAAQAAAPKPVLSRVDQFKAATAALAAHVANTPELKAAVSEVFYYEPELSSAIAVRLTISQAAPDFAAKKSAMEETVASWLEANGYAALVSRNYLGNTIVVSAADGSFGL